MIIHSFKVYVQLLSFALKRMMEYRINAIVQSLYLAVYLVMLFLIINIMFLHTTTLGGWTKTEALILFSMFNGLFFISEAVFIEGAKQFVRHGVRNGDLDKILTKPLPPSLFSVISYPNPAEMLMGGGCLVVAAYLFITNGLSISALDFALFLFSTLLCLISCYFILTSYATLTFYITKAEQILYTFDKLIDFAQYPTVIFPRFVQVSFFTIAPIALYGYAPTLFLLGKGSPGMVGALGTITIVSFIFHHFAWKFGLRNYTSASS